MSMQYVPFRKSLLTAFVSGVSFFTAACADVNVPDARNVNIPAPVTAEERRQAVNERPDSVMYLPLGEDILVPEVLSGDALPSEKVGPFELRGETLAGALQLILADYDISLAFETEEGLSRQITVANLRGDLNKVVDRVCALADLYCSYEDGGIVVKDSQVFTVTLPPIGTDSNDTSFMDDVITGLTAIVGEDVDAPVSDPTTRTIIYTATQRTAKLAENYFQRLRANTALIVFETYIWEVSLDAGNSMGINWDEFTTIGKYNVGATITGGISADFTNPVSIGLPTTSFIGSDTEPTQVVDFLSTFGAVKTISQPQISVLSGSEAELRVADTQNYVSEISTTLDQGQSTTSVSTDSVDTGFTLGISSSWDKSTVYAGVDISLENVNDIQDFTFSDGGAAGTSTTIQLPQTSERELNTQIRVRPGDSILIAGLVREADNFDTRGPGLMEPILPDSRTAKTRNLELVFMLRPRVVVYTSGADQRYKHYLEVKNEQQHLKESAARNDWMKSGDERPYKTVRQAPVESSMLPADQGVGAAQGSVVKGATGEFAQTPKDASAPVGITPEVSEPDTVSIPSPQPQPMIAPDAQNVSVPAQEEQDSLMQNQPEVPSVPSPDQEALQPLAEPAMSDEMNDIIDEVVEAEVRAVEDVQENILQQEPVAADSAVNDAPVSGLDMFPVEQSYGEPNVEVIESGQPDVYAVPSYDELQVQVDVSDEPVSSAGRVSKSVNDFSEQYVPSVFEGRVSKTIEDQ